MGHLKIYWSDHLESLASTMFSNAIPRSDPFETECTVCGSPVMAGWLKQFFLYDAPKASDTPSVLACWDFKMLHPFVNDWIAKACAGTAIGQRDPSNHPYAKAVLQWRIWRLLCENRSKEDYSSLMRYIGENPKDQDAKQWGLSQQLAKLFDDYQNYRPDLLLRWERGDITDLTPRLTWQASLWRHLLEEQSETYLDPFRQMAKTLPCCGIKEEYRRISVFHTSCMPKAYMQFFVELAAFMPVEMYVFNPSQEFWVDDPTMKQHINQLINGSDELAWLDPPHPLLSGFGRGTQAFLATIMDVENAHEECILHVPVESSKQGDRSLLHSIQQDIRLKSDPEMQKAVFKDMTSDHSLQFHICHSPMREIEVVKDLILKWFDETLSSNPQPRDVQVLVPDMETYAPFIESVFNVNDFNPSIPCTFSDRPSVKAGAIGSAFVKLMRIHESRMSASETLEILELEAVSQRYGLAPGDIHEIRALVRAANIRWGRDGAHVNSTLSPHTTTRTYPDTVTWRRGLDRLIAGFAIGRCAEDDAMIDAGELGSMCVCDGVEGPYADYVGKLAQFYDDLCDTADQLSPQKQAPIVWIDRFRSLINRFFLGTETSFKEIAELHRGINAVEKALTTAGVEDVPAMIVAQAVEAQLASMVTTGKSDTNAILFSPMRTMQVTPRKLIILLGMNEDVFPRSDQRTAFDLLAIKPRYGDRSLRHEDRLAYLEAIMSARERLIITYTGRNSSNNKLIPPSPAVTEFKQYLKELSPEKDSRLVSSFEHKLHGFNPQYYQTKSTLFSYSSSNHAAAVALSQKDKPNIPSKDNNPLQQPNVDFDQQNKTVCLETLLAFFENPAKSFYTNVLKTRLMDPTLDHLEDSEMFDGDQLDHYKLNQVLIESMLRQPEERGQAQLDLNDDYFKWLQEQALIPLGNFGQRKTRQQVLNIQTFLNSQHLPMHCKNLYQLLKCREVAKREPHPINVSCDDNVITGNLPILNSLSEDESSRFLLRFRYASLKPKDLLKGWLEHLAGHVSGENFITFIAGRDGDQLAFMILNTMGHEEAMQTLQAILRLYQRGHQAVIPFAAATSYAYAEKTLAGAEEWQAEQAAENAWSGFGYTENDDRYHHAVWQDEGPMIDKEFKGLAITFWKDFFTHLIDSEELEAFTIDGSGEAS